MTEENLQVLLDKKQNKLIAGDGISINGDVISSSGSGGSSVAVDLHMTNNIITAPNGVATFSGDMFTLKSGLTFNYSDGKSSGNKKYKVITLTEDIVEFVSAGTEAGLYVLFITEEYGFWEEPYKIFLKY